MKIITKGKLKEIKTDRRQFVVYTPNIGAAEALFSVCKPRQGWCDSEWNRPKKWINLLNHNPRSYDNIAYHIVNGCVDSYCSLEYFEEHGEHGEIFQMSALKFQKGDIVQIKKDIRSGEHGVVSEMCKYRGEFAVLTHVATDGYCKINIAPIFWWSDYVLELPRVPMTIISGVIVPKSDNLACRGETGHV